MCFWVFSHLTIAIIILSMSPRQLTRLLTDQWLSQCSRHLHGEVLWIFVYPWRRAFYVSYVRLVGKVGSWLVSWLVGLVETNQLTNQHLKTQLNAML